MDQYTLTLAREYIQLVETLRSGNYDDWHALDVERMTTHNELCRVLRVPKTDDMYRKCRNLVHQARATGDFEYDPD